MRLVELGRVATQAEMLRWRSLARRQATRMALAAIGATFGFGALVSGHVAAAIALEQYFDPLRAVGIIGGADLLIAILFFLVAARDRPGRIEREAVAVRNEARAELVRATAISAVLLPAARRGALLAIGRLFQRRRRLPPA